MCTWQYQNRCISNNLKLQISKALELKAISLYDPDTHGHVVMKIGSRSNIIRREVEELRDFGMS